MCSAGYSGTPLAKKLGIKPGVRVTAVGSVPANYEDLVKVPRDRMDALRIRRRLSGTENRFVHYFAKRSSDLERRAAALKSSLAKDGTLWISWPKLSSGIASDLTRERVRAILLKAGLVDVKVCAIDDVWSGLKFVFRLKDR